MLLTATCATLTAVLAAASPGDIIDMDVTECNESIRIVNRHFADPGVRIIAYGVRFNSLWIDRSSGIWIEGGTFEAKDGPYAFSSLSGYGAQISGGKRITITDANFTRAIKGLVIKSQSEDIHLERVTYTGMGGDGLSIANSKRVMVKNNRFANFIPARRNYHQDAIQVWRTEDVHLIGNVITGNAMGITDHGAAGDPPNQRMVIEYNDVFVKPVVTITALNTVNSTIRFNRAQSSNNPNVTVRTHASNVACGNTTPKASEATKPC